MKKPKKREVVFSKTDHRCWYCGIAITEESFIVEHQTPKKRGGGNEITNLVPSCTPCNSSKNNKNLTEYRAYLARRVCKHAMAAHKFREAASLLQSDLHFNDLMEDIEQICSLLDSMTCAKIVFFGEKK